MVASISVTTGIPCEVAFGGGRQALYSIFEKVGYNPDWFAEQWIEIQKNGFGSFGDALQWFETHAKVKYNKVHDSMGEHYSKNPGSISVV